MSEPLGMAGRAGDPRAWIPSAITVGRALLVLPIIALMRPEQPWACVASAVIFACAASLDLLDGALARRWQVVSDFGKFADPLADKLLVFTVLIFAVAQGRVAPALVALLLAREWVVAGARLIALERELVLAAGGLAKLKTALQMTSLGLVLWHAPWTIGPISIDVAALGRLGLWLSVGLSWLSGAGYLGLALAAPRAPERRR